MNHDYAEALAEFSALTDNRTGIIGSVDLIKLSESDPVAYVANAEPCDTTPLVGLPAANRGAACSASAERAVLRACGESVERYCSAFFDIGSLLAASDAELEAAGRMYIPTEQLYPFAPSQYAEPGFPFQPTTGRIVRWIEGTSAITRRDRPHPRKLRVRAVPVRSPGRAVHPHADLDRARAAGMSTRASPRECSRSSSAMR